MTDLEVLTKVIAREQVQDVMNRRAYYSANNERQREIDELWVNGDKSKTASYGKNWGYYVGIDSISNYYVKRYNERLWQQLGWFCAANAEYKMVDDNLGIGTVSFHPVTTPLIEIADDGKTARGLWYSIGQQTEISESGSPKAFWVAYKMGADLVLQNGQWRIWHLVEVYDVVNNDGEDYKNTPYIYEDEHPMEKEFGIPDIPMITHDERFNWWDNYPPEPQPYVTFSNNESYGPQGHPSYVEKEVEKI